MRGVRRWFLQNKSLVYGAVGFTAPAIVAIWAITGTPLIGAITVPVVVALAIGSTSLVVAIHDRQVRRYVQACVLRPTESNQRRLADKLSVLPMNEVMKHLKAIDPEGLSTADNERELAETDRDFQSCVVRSLRTALDARGRN